jgi:hypothetical protein
VIGAGAALEIVVGQNPTLRVDGPQRIEHDAAFLVGAEGCECLLGLFADIGFDLFETLGLAGLGEPVLDVGVERQRDQRGGSAARVVLQIPTDGLRGRGQQTARRDARVAVRDRRGQVDQEDGTREQHGQHDVPEA